jgi:hypothetical protein
MNDPLIEYYVKKKPIYSEASHEQGSGKTVIAFYSDEDRKNLICVKTFKSSAHYVLITVYKDIERTIKIGSDITTNKEAIKGVCGR